MASKRIDIQINGEDRTAGAFQKAAQGIKGISAEANKAGATVGSALNRGINIGISGFKSLASTAASTFNTIKAGAAAAANSLGGLSNALAGVLGGFSAMQAVQLAWEGATQRQFNQMYLSTKLGVDGAKAMINEINKIVAVVPGDDTWMNALLSGAVAKQTNLTSKELTDLAWISAKYVTAAQQTGASVLPVNAQREITQYIKTGNTSLMARDGLLRNHLDELQNTKTVQERIAKLQKIMTEEGYMQLDIQDLASSKWEVIKGKIGLAAANVGTKLLPFVEKVLDTLTWMDEKTNGWSTTIAFVGVAIGGLALALTPILMTTIAAARAMAVYRKEAEAAAIANALNKGAPSPVPLGPAGGAPGIWQRAGSYISTGLMSVMSAIGVQMAAGATWAGTFSSLALGIVNGIGAAILRIGPAPIIAAISGLFENLTPELPGTGSFLSGNWDFWKSFNEQFGPGSPTAANIENLHQQWDGMTQSMRDTAKVINDWATNSSNIINAWIGNIVPSLTAAANYIRGAWNNTVGSIISGWNWVKSTVSGWINTGINVATGSIDAARRAYNDLKNYIMNNPIVQTVKTLFSGSSGPIGARGPSAARGPGIGLSYENYAGHKKNAWNASGTGLSGNCVDMTLGLMSAYGGNMVSGTWNGGAHVWWQSPSGAQLDPARKALEGTWTPPARGPGNGNFGNIVIQGDVYGFDDFKRKVEQANASIGFDAGMF